MRWAPASLLACALAACGDPLLPSDYSAPPADEVSGVARFDREIPTRSARLSVLWLNLAEVPGNPAGSADALTEQTLRFKRSTTLATDWTIALYRPDSATRSSLPGAEGDLQIVAGKLVYFDDRDGDTRLSWACVEGDTCDRLLSTSQEFVVYAPEALRCQEPTLGASEVSRAASEPGRAAVHLPAGFHYFRHSGDRVEPLPAGHVLSFVAPPDARGDEQAARLAAELGAFAAALARGFAPDPFGGCAVLPSAPR